MLIVYRVYARVPVEQLSSRRKATCIASFTDSENGPNMD